MDNNYVQHLRYKLQKRVRKLSSTEFQTFHFAVRRFWGFLQEHSLFRGVLQDLEMTCPEAEQDAEKIFSEEPLVGQTDIEEAAIALFVIRKCAESESDQVEINIGFQYAHESKYNDNLEYFKSIFLEPLYEYIDEQLDDQRAILALLRKYKHKCEWFLREQLLARYGDGATSRKGEEVLARHLYEYLHDQGIEFSIETSSISGEADLISAQKTDDPLIADVKIFDPEKNKGTAYICKGFHQVYQYTLDYNEPFGYLIIFNTGTDKLSISSQSQEQSVPFFIHDNKTIFFMVIDIAEHEKSASQRGKLKSYTITSEDLVSQLTSPPDNAKTDDTKADQ